MDIAKDFPILEKKINGHQLIYFDNAASTQKPWQVIDAIRDFYAYHYAPVFRGIYSLAEQATAHYELVREKTAHFINAKFPDEIVFTSGATEGINAIAQSWGMKNIAKDDEIILTQMEHHANVLPWQDVAKKTRAVLKYIPVLPDGTLDLHAMYDLITKQTKLVSVVHVSNALGTHNDVKTIAEQAHAVGAKVLVDACQSAPHHALDVQDLNCDFLVFSVHKMFGPTGLGVSYIKKELQKSMPPYKLGGGMVREVDLYTATFPDTHEKFNAGTPPIAQVIGFGATLDYLNAHIHKKPDQKHTAALCSKLIDGLLMLPGVHVLGPIQQLKKEGYIVTFRVDGYHAHDIAAYLDQFGICVRAGHFCCQPLFRVLGIEGGVRVSFAAYNTLQEVDRFLEVMKALLG